MTDPKRDRQAGTDGDPGGDTLPLGVPPESETSHEDLSFTEDVGLHSLRDADAGGPGLTTMEDPDEVPETWPEPEEEDRGEPAR